MTTDTTNHHPDPAIHDHDRRDDPGLRYPCPNWKLGAWTDYPPCQRCGHYHQSTPDRCVGAVALADEADRDPSRCCGHPPAPAPPSCPATVPSTSSTSSAVSVMPATQPNRPLCLQRIAAVAGRSLNTVAG